MSNILCITSGLTGITNASLELCSRLQRDGHSVMYGCIRDVKAKVENHVARYLQFPEILPDPSPTLPAFKGPAIKFRRLAYKYFYHQSRREKAYQQNFPSAFIKFIKQEQIDLVIVDQELHEYIIAAHHLSIPVILLSQWFSNWYRPGLPYLLSETLPIVGQKVLDKEWLRVKKERAQTFFRKRIRSAGTDRRSIVLDMAVRMNFPRKFIGENYWPGPFLFNELPVISMTPYELEFDHDIRDYMIYVGPMVFEARTTEESTDLLNKIDNEKNNGNHIIYCSLSTLHAGDLDFLNKVLDSIRDLDSVFLVVSLGGKIETSELGIIPENVVVKNQVPQLDVLKRADCSINHGGIHTINECIHYGVPMLVYSGKKSDQNGCAARVHFHKIGIRGDKDKDNAKMISSKIHDILTDPKYKGNISVMKQMSEQYKKNKTLESFINEYLNRK